ncbi:MAG: aminoacetone oxidase family FAD-binding enzyme [Candidatus Staskawiczbacteria bacterium]|nr:aminoacetone oxidase family FAD-binding enzyme [Candidatus Staskawiczbacteria bacterium]
MQNIYDVVVIGGGPAGMMSAGRAAENGRSVLLLEKNPGLGKKLLITGGGRCNVTNNKTEVRAMLSKYKGNDQFLFSAFAQFSAKDTLEFFNSRGLETKEENEGRIFPVTDSAKSVFDVLVKYMREGKVEVQTGVEVAELSVDTKTKNIVIKNKNGGDIIAASCILATGGISRPETGSTGEGFNWLKNLGHTIIENDFALVPVALSDTWAKKLGGVTLKDVKLTTFQNNQKQAMNKGSMMFTHFGMTGPLVLNMSKEIGELLKYGQVTAELDLFPSQDAGAFKKQLQELLAGEPNKKIKNVLSDIVSSALTDALLKIADINGDTKNNLVSADARKKLALLVKAIPLNISHLLGADKAVVSSGGVALPEVNFKTMQSRKIPNLYLVGDVLNIDRPSGGYSLQLCWTTGFVAGNSV